MVSLKGATYCSSLFYERGAWLIRKEPYTVAVNFRSVVHG